MGDNPVYINGLLDCGFENDDIPMLIEQVLEVADVGMTADEEPLYSYLIAADGTVIDESTTNLTDVKRTFTEYGKGSLLMWYEDIDFLLRINNEHPHLPDSPVYTASIEGTHFTLAEPMAETRIEQAIDLAVELYLQINPTYSFGCMGGDPPPNRDALTDGILDRLHWLNILPPRIVTRLGHDQVLSASAWRVNELEDGSVLLVDHPNPRRPGDEHSIGELEAYLNL